MVRLRELRDAANMTQKDLGKYLNVRNTAVCQYESGTRQLDPDKICALCDLFDVSADYLLGRSEIKKPELSDDEFRLVEAFRAADPDLQELILRNLKIEKPSEKKAVS